ncbi:glycosyltransferase family 2 protein [Actinotalea soli]|uniref:glycosyltransferase family 2 protein n=1 Tax=Actinotalea soli TaxID=2819234 RepID=UPI0027DE0939|nr:glycosyltransferase family 2 protein [Actinotalea soli]
MPLTLSVVIPAKDDAPALERCLTLLDAQTLPPLEVVVVDNGSRDSTAEVALAHGARVVPEPARGIPAAAATGYDAARGEVVVRCDADSRPPADWLVRIARAFEDSPELEALTGSGDFYDLPPGRSRLHGRLYLWSYYVTMHAALAHRPLWGSNMAMRRSRWEAVSAEVHRTDPELHDDVDLSFVLGPRLVVRYDPTLRVGVSGRSLQGGELLRRRFRRAFRTLAVNWRDTPPWSRWAQRLGPARAGSPPRA